MEKMQFIPCVLLNRRVVCRKTSETRTLTPNVITVVEYLVFFDFHLYPSFKNGYSVY